MFGKYLKYKTKYESVIKRTEETNSEPNKYDPAVTHPASINPEISPKPNIDSKTQE